MSSVDDRIVNMQFNNKQFQAGAADSSKSLAALEAQIAKTGSGGSLDNLGKSIDNVGSHFSALQVTGVTALATLVSKATSSAIDFGKGLLSSMTSTIFGAGKERAIALEQAKFQFKGLGLNIKKTMASALEAVDGTAYGLQDAATLAAQFGGAGIKAGDQMTGALRAVSGLAAQTGRSYAELGQVMAGIAGVGKVTTQDLNQFGVRGLNVAAKMAEQMGTTEAAVREMVSKGQIDFRTFAKYMDEAFGKNATQSNKTYTGSLANMKAALSRIGADAATPRLRALRNIFNGITPVINSVRAALTPLQEAFGKIEIKKSKEIAAFLKSLDVSKIIGPMLNGIKNIFSPLIAIFKTLGDAWRQVFPASESKGQSTAIYTIANAFETMTKPLAWLAEQIPKLTPVFVALFNVIKSGVSAASSLGSILQGLVQKGSNIGQNLLAGILNGFNANSIKMAVTDLAKNIIEWFKNALGIHSPSTEAEPIGEGIIQGILLGIKNAGAFLINALATFGKAIIDGLKDAFGGMSPIDWTTLFNAILTGGVLLSLRSLAKTLKSFVGDLQGTLDAFTGPFKQLTATLKTMQQEVKSRVIKTIAISVGILAAALIALAFVPMDKMTRGLGGLTAIMALMTGMLYSFSKIPKDGLIAASGAIFIVSNSLAILSAVVATLGLLPLDKVAQGIGAMAATLVIMVAALGALSAIPKENVVASASAILILSSALNVLVGAIAILGVMPFNNVVQGIGAMALALGIMVLALDNISAIPKENVVAAAAAILILSSAMVVMSAAVIAMGKLDLGDLAKGIGSMVIGLGSMVVALGVLVGMGPTVIVAAQSLLIVSTAMLAFAAAVSILGKMDGGDLAKGIIALAVGLGIFLVAAAAASAPPIALGLLVLGASMTAIGTGAALMGVGLLAAATAFTLFAAVSGVGIAAIIAGLTALMGLLPTFAMQLATSIVVFIETIAAMAPRLRVAFGKILEAILGTIQDALPHITSLIEELVHDILDSLDKAIPDAQRLLSDLIAALIQTIANATNDLVNAGVKLVEDILTGLGKHVKKIIAAGTTLITNFITGIGKAASDIAKACGDTIVTFLDEMRKAIDIYMPQIEEKGRLLAGAIINGLTGGLAGKALDAVKSAASALADGVKSVFSFSFDINSPSKVAIYWGNMIVKGLVIGITSKIKNAVGAALAFTNAVIAAGSTRIAKFQDDATKAQIAANKAFAKASVSDTQAKKAEKTAKKSPDNKALEKQAKEARKLADKQAKAAQKAQDKADAAAQKVEDQKAFESADDVGKGDIMTDRAQALADRAAKMLAKANAEAVAAKKLTGKQRKDMEKQAKEDAASAKKLADQSKSAYDQANGYYAKSVDARIKALQDEDKARKDQAAFDAATPEQQVAILNKKAQDAQKRAEDERKHIENLIKQAQRLAKTDARQAQKLLDQAEALAAQADQDASDAKNYSDQAKQITGDTGTDSAPTIQISKSVLEQAASAIDRYTASLQQAEAAAAANQPVIQFQQYNTSPDALSEIEIYRLTNNLLSLSQIKMAADR